MKIHIQGKVYAISLHSIKSLKVNHYSWLFSFSLKNFPKIVQNRASCGNIIIYNPNSLRFLIQTGIGFDLLNATMIRSLIDLLKNLQSEEDCRLFLVNIRWHGVPVCPHCGSKSEEHYKLTNSGVFRGLYKCKDCRERFTVTVGTMFEGSHIPLQKWFIAIYVFLAHKKGISSTQLHKDIAVTQKTACIC